MTRRRSRALAACSSWLKQSQAAAAPPCPAGTTWAALGTTHRLHGARWHRRHQLVDRIGQQGLQVVQVDAPHAQQCERLHWAAHTWRLVSKLLAAGWAASVRGWLQYISGQQAGHWERTGCSAQQCCRRLQQQPGQAPRPCHGVAGQGDTWVDVAAVQPAAVAASQCTAAPSGRGCEQLN